MRTTPATIGNRETLTRHPIGRRGFTLTELLVVIGIVVLVMAMAVPAFNVLTGSRSQEMAQNQLSAALSQARILAISNQKKTGVLIFRNNEERTSIAIVESIGGERDNPYIGNAQFVDLVAGQRVLSLQKGVNLQLMERDGRYSGSRGSLMAAMNTYLGGERLLGLILFDAKGRIDTQTRWLPALHNVSGVQSRLGPLIAVDGVVPLSTPARPAIAAVLHTVNVRDSESGINAAALQQNGTLLLINRYNGTLRAPAGGSNAQDD